MPQEEKWYMVTLYDMTCHPTADWTINFFTEDIEDFQSRWFKLEHNEDIKERFLRSKSGTFETDYCVAKDAESDIVQQGMAMIYDEKRFTMSNVYFRIENAVGFSSYRSYLHADEMELRFKWIRFKKKFARVAKVKVEGLTEFDGKHKFIAAKCWSNQIMERLGDKNFDKNYDPCDSPEKFVGNSFVNICYLPSRFFDSERKLLKDTRKFIASKRYLRDLFQDFTSC